MNGRPRRFVTNASPLILLTKIDALSLMGELAEDVAVPSAVMAEVMAGTELQPRPLVEKLLRNGAYLSEHLVEAALADVGE